MITFKICGGDPQVLQTHLGEQTFFNHDFWGKNMILRGNADLGGFCGIWRDLVDFDEILIDFLRNFAPKSCQRARSRPETFCYVLQHHYGPRACLCGPWDIPKHHFRGCTGLFNDFPRVLFWPYLLIQYSTVVSCSVLVEQHRDHFHLVGRIWSHSRLC